MGYQVVVHHLFFVHLHDYSYVWLRCAIGLIKSTDRTHGHIDNSPSSSSHFKDRNQALTPALVVEPINLPAADAATQRAGRTPFQV